MNAEESDDDECVAVTCSPPSDEEEKHWEQPPDDFLQQILGKSVQEAKDFLDNKVEYDPLKAIMMWYLNAGYARFDSLDEFYEDREKYEDDPEKKDAFLKKLVEEILKQKITDAEFQNIVESYIKHQMHGKAELLACASCGLRERQVGDQQYQEYKLCELPRVFQYSKQQQDALKYDMAQGPVEIPINNSGESKKVNPWEIRSYYQANKNGTFYHVHPELVVEHENDEDEDHEKVLLCPECSKVARKKDATKPPKLSIASGLDFGNFHRIGLEAPNHHEQSVMALVRRYTKVLKICSNSIGQVNYTRCRLQAHVTMFQHDAPYIASKLFFQVAENLEDHVAGVLRLHLCDSKGK